MTTNEKIAKWLGMKQDKLEKSWWFKNNLGYILDFLHDRNQQKWIEERLIEDGYGIDYEHNQNGIDMDFKWGIVIWKDSLVISFSNESKDTAFIECVLELINKT